MYPAAYPDGVTVRRAYADEVTSEQMQTTDAICERWYDPQGNPMEPGDPGKYPKYFLRDYSEFLP